MTTQLQRYLTLDGVELINGWRTRQYAELGLINGWTLAPCEDTTLLNGIDETGPFNNPVTDPAPWYDANDSDSAHFFGIEVRSFTSEVPLERVNGTSRRVGRLQTKVRRFTLEVDLIADNCCGTDYGKRWLLALFQAGCGAGCATLTGVLRTCDKDGAAGIRDVYGIGLVSFEDITPDTMGCCDGMRATVVFDAENPYLYGSSIGALAATAWDFDGATEDTNCVRWDDCPEPLATACADPNGPTIAPPPLPSLAGPLAPGGSNAPWCNPTFEITQCVGLPTLPTFGEAVYRFTVFAGAAEMRNARIRVFPGSCDGDGPIALGVTPIEELRISYVPAGATLVVDGSTRTVSLYCPDIDQWINADSLTYGAYNTFWQHPVIGCGIGPLCACMTVDAEHTSDEATFTVEVIPRYL